MQRWTFTATVLLITFARLSALEELHQSGFDGPQNYLAAIKQRPEIQPWRIKGIQSFTENAGIIFTDTSIFKTENAGENWAEIVLPRREDEIISSVLFFNELKGWVVLTDYHAVRLLRTNDGGQNWESSKVKLRLADLQEASLYKVTLLAIDEKNLKLILRLASSSNFIRTANYETFDGGRSWIFKSSLSRIKNNDEENDEDNNSSWLLSTEGFCAGFKVGCFQESKLFINGVEATPIPIKELVELEKIKLRLSIENSIFITNQPGGSVRTSLNRGFDKCTAAPVSQMQIWWDYSPFYDANIYISGRNRGCSQPQLSASWIKQVSSMGWGLIPTVVGYQAPCSSCTSCAKHSLDPTISEQKGRVEADIAIADSNNLGLTQGTVLYYDMERYDETSSTIGCRNAVKAFLKGWTDRLKELGYISGVYGSPTNAVNDWINIPVQSRMDSVWLARWDNIASVWFYAPPSPSVPTNIWNLRQRIKQYQGPHNETWGGVTFNIDSNIAEGPVAGFAAPKNKPADFDGDGKTDISVFRPSEGAWYILQSSTQTLAAFNFGISSDIPIPQDYDGNGKTDIAVFRSSEGNWYIQNRVFRSHQFGNSNDKPVPADYNGDGFADLAVFRNSTGFWYIWNSSGSPNPLQAEQFGLSSDKPVPGDYDGDGRTDIAVFRDGVWYLLRSQEGFISIQFGLASDTPVPGDYDGDGKVDIAVFRNGTWYILRSTSGFTSITFGMADDIPLPATYLSIN